MLPEDNVHTHIHKHTSRKREERVVISGVELSARKTDTKEKEFYCESVNTEGKFNKSSSLFDLCNIALGSTLGLHFQKPAAVTLGSERPLRVLEVVKYLERPGTFLCAWPVEIQIKKQSAIL